MRCQTLILFLFLLLVACTPAPDPTPESYYGIDQPAPIRYICRQGSNDTEVYSYDGFVTLLDASRVDHILIDEDNTAFPESGNQFFSIQTSIEFSDLCPNPRVVGSHLILVCGDDQHSPKYMSTVFVIDVGLGYVFSYEVSDTVDFSECQILLPDEATIPVWPVSDLYK